MIEVLKMKIRESERPVGVKRSTRIKVPPEDHIYGFQVQKDPEGVDTSKIINYNFNFIFQL